MAIGAGMYYVGVVSTVIIIVAQIVLHLRGGWNKQVKTKSIIIKDIDKQNYQEYIIAKLQEIGVKVIDVNIDKSGELKNYTITIEYSNEVEEEDIISEVEYDCLLKV